MTNDDKRAILRAAGFNFEHAPGERSSIGRYFYQRAQAGYLHIVPEDDLNTAVVIRLFRPGVLRRVETHAVSYKGGKFILKD